MILIGSHALGRRPRALMILIGRHVTTKEARYPAGAFDTLLVHHAVENMDQQIGMVFQADLPDPLDGKLLVDHRLDPAPQGRMIRRHFNLTPSVRDPRKGKAVKRRELDGGIEVCDHLWPRCTASGSDPPHRQPQDQESEVHLSSLTCLRCLIMPLQLCGPALGSISSPAESARPAQTSRSPGFCFRVADTGRPS